MTRAEKYRFWVYHADYDLVTAEILTREERWVYVTFTCEQAIERVLKGMYVYYTGKELPKTHNVIFIVNMLSKVPAFLQAVDIEAFREVYKKYEDYFSDLVYYYLSDYPFSYKKMLSRFVDESVGKDILQKTKEVYAWLKSLQPVDTDGPLPEMI